VETAMAGRLIAIGFESSIGVLCNTCCVKCGVWCGTDESGRLINFDSLPHRCTLAQARRMPLRNDHGDVPW